MIRRGSDNTKANESRMRFGNESPFDGLLGSGGAGLADDDHQSGDDEEAPLLGPHAAAAASARSGDSGQDDYEDELFSGNSSNVASLIYAVQKPMCPHQYVEVFERVIYVGLSGFAPYCFVIALSTHELNSPLAKELVTYGVPLLAASLLLLKEVTGHKILQRAPTWDCRNVALNLTSYGIDSVVTGALPTIAPLLQGLYFSAHSFSMYAIWLACGVAFSGLANTVIATTKLAARRRVNRRGCHMSDYFEMAKNTLMFGPPAFAAYLFVAANSENFMRWVRENNIDQDMATYGSMGLGTVLVFLKELANKYLECFSEEDRISCGEKTFRAVCKAYAKSLDTLTTGSLLVVGVLLYGVVDQTVTFDTLAIITVAGVCLNALLKLIAGIAECCESKPVSFAPVATH